MPRFLLARASVMISLKKTKILKETFQTGLIFKIVNLCLLHPPPPYQLIICCFQMKTYTFVSAIYVFFMQHYFKNIQLYSFCSWGAKKKKAHWMIQITIEPLSGNSQLSEVYLHFFGGCCSTQSLFRLAVYKQGKAENTSKWLPYHSQAEQ